MCKALETFSEEYPRKRRINMNEEKDYEYLLQVMERDEPALITLDRADLDTLRAGEAVFLWESALAATVDEGIAMAKSAAEAMTPASGNVMAASVMLMMIDYDWGLEDIEQIAHQMFEALPESSHLIFGAYFSEKQKGIRFALATAEGRADTP